MLEQLLVWKSLIIGVWLALFFLLERLVPASPWKKPVAGQQFSQLRHLSQNLTLWVVNVLLSPLLIVGFTMLAVDHSLGWRQGIWTVPPGVGLFLDLVVLDLWIYAWHRSNHCFPLLWRFHQVHHLDQQLDTTSALRFHFGEVILSALARIPVIYLFDMPLTSVVIFETLVSLAAIFHHANVRLPAGVEKLLSVVIITPSLHWVHHHAVRVDTDSNYGTVLSLWDRMFGSRSNTVRSAEMVLGVENHVENRIPRLLLLPFHQSR